MKYEGFKDLDDVKNEFECDCDGITEEEVLFASYGRVCYDGDAVVLIRRDGKLYTVESSHCSCNHLGGTWDMVETTKEVLRKRKFDLDHNDGLLKFLKEFLNQ